MREIKFRCWHICDWDDDNAKPKWEMIDGDSLAFESYEPLKDLLTSNELTDIYMQYTGLKDKNGKEIYVGDICKFYECPEEDVFFHGIAKVIDTQTGWEWEIVKQENIIIDSSSFWNDDFEVIGDVYQNPELLDEN